MFEVNRSLVLLKPNQVFFEWLGQLPGIDLNELNLAELKQSCNAILIPPADDIEEAKGYVYEQYLNLFDAELADWCEEESLWPENRDVELFKQWFSLEVHAILTDIVEEPLEREEFNPFDLDY